MKHFGRLTGIMLFLSLSFSFLHAQDLGDLTKARMAFIFEHLDKDKVETGLLSDYGCLWTEPYAYNGVLTDTNYVCMETWKSLYLSMYTTRINNKVTLREPQVVFNSLRDDTPTLLCMQYNRLDETAVNNGLLKFENEQLWETGRVGSPYLKEYLFAVALPHSEYHSQVSFTFHQENYISNFRGTPFQLAIRFAPGSAYQPVTWGQPVSHTFTSLGEKEISVRVSFNNGKTLESHARIQIIPQPIRYTGGKPDAEISIGVSTKHSGGRIQIKYATFNTEKKQLIRPLIIADESDIYKLLENKEINLEFLFEKLSGIDEINKLYDIVYVDNNKGFDDIIRNAQLFEDAMERINNMRGSIHDQNYVIGLGMGGLVASYALRDMEKQGKNHDVCKLITINTPHKGFNMPLGLQALIRHVQDIKLAKLFMKDISEEAKKLCDLLDQTAMKQMLTYSIDNNFSYQNDHDAFMQKYESMGMPRSCRTIAVSNGSYLGNNLFQPGGRLFEYYFKKGTKSFFWKLFLLGNTEIRLDLIADALKSRQATQLYYGNLYLHKKILFKYIDINYNTKTLNSTGDMVALDGAPGSKISVKQFFKGDDVLSNAFKQNDFCFVPTASALGISDWQNKLLSGINLNSETSGFDKLYSMEGNNDYAELAACKEFLLQELAPRIEGDAKEISGQRTFTIYNVPAGIPLTWTFSNDNFKVVSHSGSAVTITPLKFNCTSELQASINFPIGGKFVSIALASLPVSSMFIIFEPGNPYISTLKNRYAIYTIPENTTLSWCCSQGLTIDDQADKYVIVHTDNYVTDPWIEAVVTTDAYHTETAVRMNLKCKSLVSVAMEQVGDPWWEDGHKKYDFYVSYEPSDIPLAQLQFCWGNTVTKRVLGPFERVFQGIANLDTDGDVDSGSGCKGIVVIGPDLPSLDTHPLITIPRTAGATPGPITDWRPLPLRGVNHAVVIMPSIDHGERAHGYVSCTVDDHLGKRIKVTYEKELISEWNIVYHVAPNPVSTTLTVSKASMNNGVISTYASTSASEMLTLNLYNDFGLVRSMEADASQSDIQMNVADLPNGTYYLNIIKEGEVIDRQVVMIKH